MTAVRRLALLAVVLAALAGCGGDAQPGSGAAEVVPGGVPVFVSVDTDFDGDQWSRVEELIRRFPGGGKALDKFIAELGTQEGLDFEQDVKPALGPETALVVLELDPKAAQPPVVALTQPSDPQKLQALLEKAKDPLVSENYEGWTIFSDSQENLDRFRELNGGGKLADSDAWSRAMDGLPEDTLASAFVDAEALRGALESDPAAQGQLELFFPGDELPAIGAVLRAEGDGAHVEGRLAFQERPEGLWSSAYEAQLPGEVPDGVLFYASFNDLERQFSRFRDALAGSNPEFERQLAQAEAFLGVSLEEDVAPLFSGEGALYVRRGGLIPEFTLLLEVEDEARAVETVDDIVSAVGTFLPTGTGAPRDVEVAGVQARELPLGDAPISLYYAGFDGRLVVTTSREGISDLREDGDRFADSEAFSQAKELAGMPDETVGFLYADLQEIIPYVLGIAGLSGGKVPPDVEANLEPLQQLIVYGSEEDSSLRFAAFLGIE